MELAFGIVVIVVSLAAAVLSILAYVGVGTSTDRSAEREASPSTRVM